MNNNGPIDNHRHQEDPDFAGEPTTPLIAEPWDAASEYRLQRNHELDRRTGSYVAAPLHEGGFRAHNLRGVDRREVRVAAFPHEDQVDRGPLPSRAKSWKLEPSDSSVRLPPFVRDHVFRLAHGGEP